MEMNERLRRLKELVKELKVQSYANQYSLVPLVEFGSASKKKLDALANETAMYQEMLKMIDGQFYQSAYHLLVDYEMKRNSCSLEEADMHVSIYLESKKEDGI